MDVSGIQAKYSGVLNNSNVSETLAHEEHSLWKILAETPGYIYLKKTSDMTYIDCNKQMIDLFSTNCDQEIVNKSNIMVKNNACFPSLSAFIETVEELEHKAIMNKTQYKDIVTEPFLNMKGQVVQLSITISPIINPQNFKVSAIIFYGYDVTPKKPHDDLHITYDHLYEDKKMALTRFLEHIGFSNYIVNKNNITKREFEILRIFSDGKTAKEIANTLNISSRTVEIHLDKIKLKVNARNKIEVMRKFLMCYKS